MRLWPTVLALLLALLTAGPAWASTSRGHGTIVVAIDDAARPAAKTLARVVYQDAALRPAMSEATAKALVGEAPAKPAAGNETKTPQPNKLAEIASVIKAARETKDSTIRRRLLASVGSDLGAELLVFVEQATAGPSARVMRVADQRFLAVVLAPGTKKSDSGAAAHDWSDALAILRGLAKGAPPPGPRSSSPAGNPGMLDKGGPQGTAAKPGNGAKPGDGTKPDDGKKDRNFLTSPWFWGGLGVVLSVGVTVLVLSQTALNEPDVVMLEGHVSP